MRVRVCHACINKWLCRISLNYWFTSGDATANLEITTILSLLKACTNIRDLESGRKIHKEAIKEYNIHVANTLVNMYGKCGSMTEARYVFNGIRSPDVVSWNALILGYVVNGEEEVALKVFEHLGDRADSRTYVAAMMACSSLAERQQSRLVCLEKAKELHSRTLATGGVYDIYVANTLIDAYAKCGSVVELLVVFQRMPCHSVVSWNALIMGCAENGERGLALECFQQMQNQGCQPDPRTFVAALVACSGVRKTRERLVAIHSQATEAGCDTQIFVASALIDAYSKHGDMRGAQTVFDKVTSHNVVSWTSLVLGYVENEECQVALECFEKMHCVPNARTVVAALVACSSLAGKSKVKLDIVKKGMSIHSQLVHNVDACDHMVQNNLVVMYTRCGSMLDARLVFDKMSDWDVVSWNALLLGYVENGYSELALDLFFQIADYITPDARSFEAALTACGSLQFGMFIDGEIHRSGLEEDIFVANSVIGMYGRCGCIDKAVSVFMSMCKVNTVTFSSLMAAYSCQGDAKQVLDLFDTMHNEEMEHNEVTFISVLTSCSRAGLIEKGKQLLHITNVTKRVEHYHCVIDMLARANLLEEALEMVKEMPFKATVVTWTVILSACHKWSNVDVGRVAFESLVELDNTQLVAYVLMSNIFASAGMWEEQAKILAMKRTHLRPVLSSG